MQFDSFVSYFKIWLKKILSRIVKYACLYHIQWMRKRKFEITLFFYCICKSLKERKIKQEHNFQNVLSISMFFLDLNFQQSFQGLWKTHLLSKLLSFHNMCVPVGVKLPNLKKLPTWQININKLKEITFDCGWFRCQFLLEGFERSKISFDLFGQIPLWETTSSWWWGHVGPENRVVDMTTTIEIDSFGHWKFILN